MAERRGSIITCDRCGAQALGEIVTESGVGVPRYPEGWRTGESVIGRGYRDLCPTCSREFLELTDRWWRDERDA
jgi:hypothetical protein